MVLIAVVVAAALAAGRLAQHRRPDAVPLLVQRLLGLMITVLVPVVTFVNVNRLAFDRDVVGGILLGYVALALTGVIAATVGTRVLRLSRPSTGSLVGMSMQANSGYLGLPITAVLLGSQEVTVAVGYDALVVAPVFIVGVLGAAAAYGTKAGEGGTARLKTFLLRNPPLIAAVAGLLVPHAIAPDWAVDVSRGIIYAQLPLGCFAVGAILAAEGLPVLPPLRRHVVAGLLLRSVVAPGLLVLLALPLIDLPRSYVILAAMSPGLTGVGVAQRFGLDVPFQAAAIAWGTTLVIAAGLVLELVT
jgi:malate permease and related proteins